MLFHPFLLGLLYLGFFELYFLFTNNKLLVGVYFVALVIYTAVRLLFHVGEALVRRWVLVTFFLLLFVFVTMYVSVIEVAWLRHVGGIGFSIFTSFLVLLLSTGKGDIRARPRSFVSATYLTGLLLMLFSSSFFHSLKLFLTVRQIGWPILVALIHAVIVYLLFLSLRIPSRGIIPATLVTFIASFQLFWVVEFLPFGALTLGLLHVIPLSLYVMFERDRLLDDVRPQEYIRFALEACALVVVILFFTRWN
ncbi:MAG: hypothetical protein CMI52_00115 [Parcubacteria group bacterium]|nr:hypothetical protein [Parcubacteria group bacterium]